ncbi:unnamed protein product [Diamesa serratosioi]
MDLDKVLEEIGEFGKYQKIKYFLLCIPVFFGAANSLSYVFTAGKQHYRCLIPECEQINAQYTDGINWTQNAYPGQMGVYGDFVAKDCKRFTTFSTNNTSNDTCALLSFTKESISCNEFVFDTTDRTIVQDWNLTCEENDWKLPFVGTVHFIGVICGSIWMLFGDFFGRKGVLIWATLFMSITGICQALAWNYQVFIVFAFLNAIGISGVYPMAFVLGMELVGKQKRGVVGMVCNYFYAIGEAVLGLTALLCGDWVFLQILMSVPPLIVVSYYWIIPESVRWHLAKNQNIKAIKIIKQAAKTNGVQLTAETAKLFQKLEAEEIEQQQNDSTQHKTVLSNNGEIMASVRKMLQSKIMIKRILILLYNFIINALVYYGLSLNSVSLSGNKYFNFILVSLIELPGYYLGFVAMEKYGRRLSLAGAMILCGLTCVVCGYSDIYWLKIALFLIGKLGITSSFGILYVQCNELFPTLIRSGCVGFFGTMARVGATISPFIPVLATYYKPLPFIVYGITASFGGLLALNLPETNKRQLPTTVEEAARIEFATQDDTEIPLNR